MNFMNFVFLETYCRKHFAENESKDSPDFCASNCVPCYTCIQNNCPYLDFTSAENAFAYIGEDSSSKEEILLDKDADLLLWEKICRKKIKEAWEEYTKIHPETSEQN
ncbi:MAG: hypothetical protein IJA86_07755 [Clostridia bacterium]|nr:hypothetical protein [Clostridia bacterium]